MDSRRTQPPQCSSASGPGAWQEARSGGPHYYTGTQANRHDVGSPAAGARGEESARGEQSEYGKCYQASADGRSGAGRGQRSWHSDACLCHDQAHTACTRE